MRKSLKISGYEHDGKSRPKQVTFNIELTTDKTGSTLSIDNGVLLYTLPFDKVMGLILNIRRA